MGISAMPRAALALCVWACVVAVVFASETDEIVSLQEDTTNFLALGKKSAASEAAKTKPAPVKKHKPVPDRYAIPPYKQWAKEAHAFPDKKLVPRKPRATQKKPTTRADIDKYGKGARGDAKARKFAGKEMKTKASINNKSTKSSKGEKKVADDKKKKAKGDIAVKKFAVQQKKDKKAEKKAAKPPKKKQPDAAEKRAKRAQAKKNRAQAGADSNKSNDGSNKHNERVWSMFDLGEVLRGEVSKGSCDKASSGILSICKLSGQGSKSCRSAKKAYSKKCGFKAVKTATRQVSKLKKKAAKKLGKKLRRVKPTNEETFEDSQDAAEGCWQQES